MSTLSNLVINKVKEKTLSSNSETNISSITEEIDNTVSEVSDESNELCDLLDLPNISEILEKKLSLENLLNTVYESFYDKLNNVSEYLNGVFSVLDGSESNTSKLLSVKDILEKVLRELEGGYEALIDCISPSGLGEMEEVFSASKDIYSTVQSFISNKEDSSSCLECVKQNTLSLKNKTNSLQCCITDEIRIGEKTLSFVNESFVNSSLNVSSSGTLLNKIIG
jgi:hypothetical protein